MKTPGMIVDGGLSARLHGAPAGSPNANSAVATKGLARAYATPLPTEQDTMNSNCTRDVPVRATHAGSPYTHTSRHGFGGNTMSPRALT